ncbi:MAG: ChaN family lipoprotein [Alphaproteobacteria bacterium]|nr:ChaN family lipoprotein [Alphaproteobacteria bacterium]MCB9699447.1 ChaN family lipoprotein [Alphaproteobacteria bacterium]
MKRLLCVVLAVGCHHAAPAPAAAEIEQVGATVAMATLQLPDMDPEQRLTHEWKSEVGVDHPLVGWVYSARSRQFAGWDDLVADLRGARWVFLGEKHDNADHHALQAEVIAALAPKVAVFEHLDHEDPIEGATTAAELAEASHWAESGWPPFELYEPIFTALYAGGGQVVAGHPTKAEVKLVMSEGFEALPAEAREGLPESPALPPEAQADLDAQIVDSHCGMATPEIVEKMRRAQLLKDTWMAREMTRHEASPPPTVLVAGNGHTRADRGVPFWLEGEKRTVAFLEVADDAFEPGEYVEGADWIVFTPRVDDEDPCAAFRK